MTDENAWSRAMGALLLTPFLTVAHVFYGVATSLALFRLAGGIQQEGRWTHYGGIAWSETNLAWLPGGLLLPAVPVLGLLVVLAGSFLVGLATATLIASLGRNRSGLLGPYYWRLGVLLCWLVWVPVPVQMTLTYWHTVAY